MSVRHASIPILMLALMSFAYAGTTCAADDAPMSGDGPEHWTVPAAGPIGAVGTRGGYSKVDLHLNGPSATSDSGIYVVQKTSGKEIRIDGWPGDETLYRPIEGDKGSFYHLYLGYQDKLFKSSNDEVILQVFGAADDKLRATIRIHPYADRGRKKIPITFEGKAIGYYSVEHGFAGTSVSADKTDGDSSGTKNGVTPRDPASDRNGRKPSKVTPAE